MLRQSRTVRLLSWVVLALVTLTSAVVIGPAKPAFAATYRIDVRFNVGVANVKVSVCFGTEVTITNPSPTSGAPTVTANVTGNAPCTGTRIEENAAPGYYLPTSASYDSYLCNSSCTPNNPASRPSGSTRNIWTMIKTSSINSGAGESYYISFSAGSLAASPPAVTSAAAINDLTPNAGETLTGSATFSGGPTPTVEHQWYRCTNSASAVGTSIPADCTAISGATAATYVLTGDDVGSYVRYAAVATNASGTATSISKAETAAGVSAPGTPDLDTASDLGSSSSDNATSDNTPSVTVGSLIVGATVTLTASRSGGGSATCTMTATSSSQSCTFPEMTDGSWTVTATQTIGATTSSASSSLPLTIDTAGPATPASAPDLAAASDSGSSATDDLTNDNTPTLTVTGLTGTGTVTATKAGSSPVTCTVSAGSCTLGTLSDGTWSITVTDSDSAGNVSSASPALDITIDTVGPTVALSSSPAAGSYTSTNAFAFTATFSEAVTGFSASTSDVTVGGTSSTWTKGSSTGSTTTYAFDVTSASPSGGTLTVAVAAGAASDAAGNASTVSSTWTSSLVTAPPTNSAVPTVSGSATVGSTLTAATGTWDDKSDASPTTAYQWQYSGDGGATWANIPGATNATYVVADAYADDVIRVATTRTNAAGSSSPAPSTATATITYPVASNSVVPTVSGTVSAGSTLTATTGTWTGTALTFAYQWQSSTDGGSTWNNIAGATASTYAVQVADESATLRVSVAATNGNAAPASANSVGTPSANTISSVTPTDGGASVAFTASAHNGSTITGYRLVAEPVGGGTSVTTSCTTTSPCVATGLVGGTQYSFTMRPLTATVVGPVSAPVTGTPTAGTPEPPTITAVTDAGSLGAVTLAITPGDMKGSTLLGYVITTTDTTTSTTSTSTCTGSPCTVSGLIVGRSYSFVAVADSTTTRSANSNSVSWTPRTSLPAADPAPASTPSTAPASRPAIDPPQLPGGPGLKPPMITPTVTIRPAEGTSVVVTATFVAPVSPDVVSVVTFVLLDENGAVVSTMSVTVESGATSASMTLPALPEGGQVIAYSANAAGVSPNAPAGTNILNRPTGTKRRADGTVVLIGKKIADSVIFDADSPRLDKADLRILDGVVSYVASNGGTVLVSGFARRNGTDSFEYLKNLSLSRARNVSEYLSERGVRVWIRFEGYGPATRVVGTPGDRRVEVRWTLEPPTALT